MARLLPPKRPKVPGKALLVEVSVLLPDARLGFESSSEVESFVVPDKGVVGVLRCFSLKANVAGLSPEALFASAVLDHVLNNPLYGGFVSAFPPPAGLGEDAAGATPIGVPTGILNIPIDVVLEVPGSESLVAVFPGRLNNPVLGFALAGFGEGALSFCWPRSRDFLLLGLGVLVCDGIDKNLKILGVLASFGSDSGKYLGVEGNLPGVYF